MSLDALSRREFLASTTFAAAAGPLATVWGSETPEPAIARTTLSKVVRVSSDFVVRGPRVHSGTLADMLDVALRQITGKSTTAEAWRTVLRADDLIGLKFNGSAAETLGTTPAFGDALVRSLLAAGFEPRQIVPLEAPDLVARHGLVTPARGWDSVPTDFAGGQDQWHAVLSQVTAIVNVPFLKTHNIAGLTCCLKNLSHALVKHPARYHRESCAAAGGIVAAPKIRSKLRLHLVDALRMVFDGGPAASADAVWDGGVMLAGFDPVAVDTVGLEVVNQQRSIHSRSPIGGTSKTVPSLQAAAEAGLGNHLIHRIEVADFRV